MNIFQTFLKFRLNIGFKLHFKITFLSVITTATVITPGWTCLYSVESSSSKLKVAGELRMDFTIICSHKSKIRLTHEHTHEIHQHDKQPVLLQLWHDCDLLGSSGLDWNSSESCDSRCACSSGCPVTWADDVTRPHSRCGVSREWTKCVKSED